MHYTVEILNLGKRPMAGVDTTRTVIDDAEEADRAHCAAVGDMALHDGMTVVSAERRDEVGADGIMSAAILTHVDGGRIEVLLRRSGPEMAAEESGQPEWFESRR